MKRIISILILCGILIFGSSAYAGGFNIAQRSEVNLNRFQIFVPEKSNYSTEEKIVLINGRAPSGTSISINIYGTTDLTKKSFDLDKLPTDKDYIEISSETIKSGNMGFFQKQMDLVMGINKVIIDFGVDNVPQVEFIIYVYDRAVNESKELRLGSILPMMR